MKLKKNLSLFAQTAWMLSGARRLHKKNRPFCVILMMLMTMTAQTAWATPDGIIYVSAIGDDANDGSEIAPVATIGKAVEYATDGETIFINDGEYTEENTITLEKSLSFEGASQDGVKITGPNDNSLFKAATADLTLSFSNLTILNAGGEDNPAMKLTKALQDLTITNCTFDNCSSWYGAIQISKVTGEAVIDGCKILNSKCTNDGGAGAIHINNSGTFTIMNTLIDGVQFTGSSYMNGVICLYSANATLNIENTTITNVKNVDNETNVVTPVPARAVIYNQRGTVNIKDSKIQGNILKKSGPNDNNIIHNDGGTVTIDQTLISGNTCEDEVFCNNGSSSNLTVNYCNIQNNAASGIINNNGTIDLNANWWGANVLPVGVTAESWIVEEDGVLKICNHGENEEMIGEHIVPGWDGVLLITAESWGAYKNGSEENPYVINSTAALNRLAIEVNAGESYEGKFFELGADIAYTYTTDWDDDTSEENNYTAIGTYDHPFKGTFDGKNYTISGIRIYKNDDTDDEYQGLFGYVGEGGTVKNVILSDARITGHGPVGGIAGSNDGTIENCLVTASVSTTALDGDVGGIVGFNFATVKGNMVIGAIVTSGNNEAGGIAAYSSCLGVNGENPGSVTGNLVIGATVSGDSFGAIVSNNEYSNLSSNYYNGCTVGETVNATGVGVFCFDFSTGSKDITTNEGAVAGYFLTLGEGITAATAKAVVTVPEHKDLDDAGELVTVDEKTYNIFTIDQEVTLSASEEGYLLTNCTVTKDDDDSDVTYDVLSGTTLTMPDYNITVTGTTEICTPSEIEITSANFTDYFDYDGDFEYSTNATPTTGLADGGSATKGGYFLKATVAAESTLDFKGDFIPDASGNYNPRIFINKRVNITSSDKSAVFKPYIYINEDETVKLYWNFGILEGADYTVVENLQFQNCWVFNHGSSYVTFDGIDMKVEDVRIGSGIGALSIRTIQSGGHASDHTTVMNSVFYCKDNGGNSCISAACGAPYVTFHNNTITLEGNVGNGINVNTFNSDGNAPAPEYGTFTNNVITNKGPAKAICWCIIPCGQGNLIENNTINYAGNAINKQYYSSVSEEQKKNIYRNNTTTLGGSIFVYEYSVVENNQVSGQLSVAKGATATGNTVAEMTVSQDATVKSNTVNGSTTISGTNVTFQGNTVNGSATISGTNVTFQGNTVNGNTTISKTTASFTDNAINGMLTLNSASGGANDKNTITGNVILSTGQHAIELKSSDNTVSGNILISADYEGDAAVKTTRTNTIADNTLAAYESATASSHSNTPYIITSETTAIKAGDNAGTFYYVPTDATVTINDGLTITPNEGATSPKVNLMLGNGSQLNVGNISGSNCSLTLYGQSMDGMLTATGTISAKNINLNGATVTANGYSGTVTIASGKTYYDGTGASYTGTLTSYAVTDIVEKTLRPYDYRTVEYVDADGTMATATARPLRTDELPEACSGWDNLPSGWYVVENCNPDDENNGVDFYREANVRFQGDAHLILCDGAEMSVSAKGISFECNGTLTIYGQSSGSGKLSVTGDGEGLLVNGDLTINGGTINCSTTSPGYRAIYCYNVVINGGTVTAEALSDGYAIHGDNVVINGGTVTANADATNGGNAIHSSENVVINGGTVMANGTIYSENNSVTIAEGMIDCTLSGGTKRVIANGITDDVSNALKGQTVDISYSRTYTTGSGSGKASTLCLPFAFEAKADDGIYATFSEVTETAGVYEVKMTEVDAGTMLTAGTPYMFVPKTSGKLTQGNAAFTVPVEGFAGASSATNGSWQFKGTFEKKTWESGQKNLYGFAGKEYYLSNGSQIAADDIGSFRRFDYGTCAAFRCYLLAPESSGARGMSKAGSLPETLKVRLVKADGTTTAIGTLDTRTGEVEFGDDWYDLNGRRLDVKPTAKGVYINNGKKIVIKN